jgi:spore coat protein JB
MNSECLTLQKQLAQASFALDEAILFLDTHPKDAQALEYYRRKKVIRDAVLAEYVSRIGPVSAYDVPPGESWRWVETPWPWQLEG